MSSTYKVTIASDEPDKATAIITVELAAGKVRVTEVRVVIGEDGAPLPNELTHVDFSLLIKNAALMSHGQLPVDAKSPDAEAEELKPAPDHAHTKPAPARERAVVPSGPRDVDNTRRASGSARASGAPSDLAVTFWRLGSITKVAKHYDVPRHIAQDWIKVLSQEAKLPNTWSSKRPAR
ncbi:hypothetical protein [Nocardia vulneris]|uniref:hypothetical protein n=1 Tax=Nocardia vulneris TaxID=1141657 RepID=UPI0012E08A4D|nr:hypothetical protein [Nocardia vulneris]